ncbi:hypothetical protein ACP70R_040473 [Stipagrostis hirtigluma subsp. patula]
MACSTAPFPLSAPFFPSPCHHVQQLSPSAQPFQPSRVVMVRWMPPPRGWFKLNFDGSVYHDGSGRASIGGAIRDSAGRVVLAFAEKTEHSTVGIVEARALIRGLQLARGLRLERVVAEGDDLVLVQLLRGEETQTRIPVVMQEEILGLLRSFAAATSGTSTGRVTRSRTPSAARPTSRRASGWAGSCRPPCLRRPRTTAVEWRTSAPSSARREAVKRLLLGDVVHDGKPERRRAAVQRARRRRTGWREAGRTWRRGRGAGRCKERALGAEEEARERHATAVGPAGPRTCELAWKEAARHQKVLFISLMYKDRFVPCNAFIR